MAEAARGVRRVVRLVVLAGDEWWYGLMVVNSDLQ